MKPIVNKVNYAGKEILERYRNEDVSGMSVNEAYSLFKKVKKALIFEVDQVP